MHSHKYDANISEKHTATIFTAEVKIEAHALPKHWFPRARLHNVTTQKTI